VQVKRYSIRREGVGAMRRPPSRTGAPSLQDCDSGPGDLTPSTSHRARASPMGKRDGDGPPTLEEHWGEPPAA
jgi:hypothetical protein